MKLPVGNLAAVTLVLIFSAHAHRLNPSMLHLSQDQFWDLNLQAILDQLDDIDNDRTLDCDNITNHEMEMMKFQIVTFKPRNCLDMKWDSNCNTLPLTIFLIFKVFLFMDLFQT